MSESSWASRSGLLVPVDAIPVPEVVDVDEPATITTTDDVGDDEFIDDDASESEVDPVVELDTKLRTVRRSGAVKAGHDIAVRRGKLLHRRELAELEDDEEEFGADLKRRAADRQARIELESLRRTTAAGGHRARIRTMVLRSAEHRAVRIETVRQASLKVGGVVLAVMALWSTAGVHAGVVTLLKLKTGSLGWCAAWAVEPALMAIVALIIVSRSMLRSSGGALADAADKIEYGALGTSILLNLASGGLTGFTWSSVPVLLAHSIGPVGAAGVAYLIGVIDASCASADPWTGAPTMADLGLIETTETASAPQSSRENVRLVASELGERSHTPVKQPKQPVVELSPADERILAATRVAVARGELTTPVTATAIYRDVMGRRGDRGRATRVASAVAA